MQKLVDGHGNGGGKRREISKRGRKTVPQEAKVTAGTEERVQENVESEEHRERGAQRGACAVRLVQRRHVAQTHLHLFRRGHGRRVQTTEPLQEPPRVVPFGLHRRSRLGLIRILVKGDYSHRT